VPRRKRAAWEAEFKAREHEAEAARQAERQREQAQQRAELRAQAIPWAQPIRHYPPIVVHPSSKPLTEAHSPRLLTKQRATAPRT
jgi:regulator of protease activity HflC (stomatin/prohibitin superfamily)